MKFLPFTFAASCALLFAGTLFALVAEPPIREPGAALDLSISQECDAALDRARRWFLPRTADARLTGAETNLTLNAWLLRYATAAPAETVFAPSPETADAFRAFLPPPADLATLARHWLPDGPAIPAETAVTNRFLFAAQRALTPLRGSWPHDATPLPDWREAIARRVVNAQRIDSDGSGHWRSPDETFWAILTLRSLLGESPVIVPAPEKNPASKPALKGALNKEL